MEVPRNPNEALTPLFVGETLVYVPVIEYYIYTEHPELLIAQKALELTVKKPDETNQ